VLRGAGADVHGPCCTRLGPTLAQLASQDGDRVKPVFRDDPLDQLQPGARQAHEAARCAHAQGTCWASHDALCAHAPQTSPEQLKASAQDVGLDLPTFEPCVSSGTSQATVQQDIDEGTRAGVTGTPAFCINGRVISGAQPLETFTRVIEDELARAR
jgi:protein-disulfide isomerase